MSNYCGLCNGFLNGPPCHKHLEECESEAARLAEEVGRYKKALDVAMRELRVIQAPLNHAPHRWVPGEWACLSDVCKALYEIQSILGATK